MKDKILEAKENFKRCITIFLKFIAHQACPWDFHVQECRSGLPFPPPGALPNPGIKPEFPAWQADSLQ